MKHIRTLAAISLLTWAAAAGVAQGTVNFTMRSASLDSYDTNQPNGQVLTWFTQKLTRLTTYTPFWDSRLRWDSNAWVYQNLYGIPVNSPLVQQNPSWFLKDSSGHFLYLNWNCSNGSCPNYAADFGNAAFMNWWIANTQKAVAEGYKGVWIDDVDIDPTISNGQAVTVMPFDPRTGTTMTTAGWQNYMVTFLEKIRSALPNAEIVHNSVWFEGGANRDYNPLVIREIQAATHIHLERGISDSGLTNGNGIWSVNAFLAYIDHVHALGRSVLLGEYNYNGSYGLAGYFLISTGSDFEGNDAAGPYNWWSGYDVNLGTPVGARYSWNGLLRRDFSHGVVLLSAPGTGGIWSNLGGTYTNLSGQQVTGVQLFGGQGAVLTK